MLANMLHNVAFHSDYNEFLAEVGDCDECVVMISGSLG